MDKLEQAQEILRQEPLPDDAQAQIDALFEEATADEREQFAWIYEGLAVAQAAQEPDTVTIERG